MKLNPYIFWIVFAGLICSSRADAPKLAAVQRPMSDLKPLAKYSIPGFPDWLAIGDSVWISNKPKNNVSRVDPKTNQVAAVIPVGKAPCAGLALGFGSLWVPQCGDGTILRIDLRTQKPIATIKTGISNTEGGIAVGAGSVWIPSDPSGVLSRIDPATNQVISKIQLASDSNTVVFGEGAVWVTSTRHNLVTRLDPKTEKAVATIAVGPKPRFLAVGLGSVWVLNQGDGTVSRIDPKSNRVLAVIAVEVPGEGGDIDTGEGSVWVTASGKPLSRIDPSSNRVVKQFIGKGGDALRVGLGTVWLSCHEFQEVWRLDPKGL